MKANIKTMNEALLTQNLAERIERPGEDWVLHAVGPVPNLFNAYTWAPESPHILRVKPLITVGL